MSRCIRCVVAAVTLLPTSTMPSYPCTSRVSTTVMLSVPYNRLAALNEFQGATGAAVTQQAVQIKKPQPADAAQGRVPVQQAVTAVATAPGSTIEPAETSGAFPYNPLSSILPNVLAVGKLQLPARGGCPGTMEDVLEQLMTPNMPPHIARNMIATRTVDKSVVLDNPTAKLNITKPSKAGKGSRQQLASKLLPRAQRRELSELPTAGMDFAALTALHDLWGKYMSDLLAGKPDVERLLQTADWHGAILTVSSSKNAIYTGRSGIVAKATANTFVLVGSDGCSSLIPLKGSVFVCVVPGVNLAVEVTGSSQSKLQCNIKSNSTAS